MRDDTGLNFAETYDSVDVFLSAIEGIEGVALTERFDDAPLRLRLLTPCRSGSMHGRMSNLHRVLTYPLIAFGTRLSLVVNRGYHDVRLLSFIEPCDTRKLRGSHTFGLIKSASIRKTMQTASDICSLCIASTVPVLSL
jgi:hypothetical protein